MPIRLALSGSSACAVISTFAVTFVLSGARPASTQWDPRDAALSRCQQELQYRMGREAGGKQPDASIDERRAQINQLSNGETRVRGNGRYARDHNDRGRDFNFDCTYNTRNNSARTTYNWSGAGWGGGQYPDPDPGYGRPPAGGYPPTGRVFFSGGIVSRGSNKCLDVEGGSNRNEANVQQWSCSGGSNQIWDVIDLGRGEYSIINQRSNKALTVGGGGSDGANIEQNRWGGGDNQRWRLERAGNGAYRIVSRATNSCLDVEGAKREDGANIQTWGCSGGANQAWLFRK
jgi:Ricin-type beta-trefoil lectin domain-like